jgi:hypothetical protein
MPRKKKTETVSTTPKAPSKTKRIAKAKAAPKAARMTAKKTNLSKTPRPIRVPKASSTPQPSSAWKKPPRQGETQMVAFIRDPHCIFTYWEVTPQSIEGVKKQLMGEYKDSAMVLRVFHTGSDGQAELIQEIRVEPSEMNRYVELKEGTSGSYFIEIAQKAASGRIVVYARSNKVMTGTSTGSQGGPQGASTQWETPTGLLEYFSEVEEGVDPVPLRGLSSAEAHRKALLRKQIGRYSASRMG